MKTRYYFIPAGTRIKIDITPIIDTFCEDGKIDYYKIFVYCLKKYLKKN